MELGKFNHMNKKAPFLQLIVVVQYPMKKKFKIRYNYNKNILLSRK